MNNEPTMSRKSFSLKLATAALALAATVGALGVSPAHAAGLDPVNGPTAAPVESTDRVADKSVAPLNTAVITASTGNMNAQINLWRWTGSRWVKERTGTTNTTGRATFGTVRGAAFYMWITTKESVYFDADGNSHPCSFYTWSTDRGIWVPRGATKAVPMYAATNTCGA